MVRYGDFLIDEIPYSSADQMMSEFRESVKREEDAHIFTMLGVTWYSGAKWYSIAYKAKYTQRSHSIALVVNDYKKWMLAKLKYPFLNEVPLFKR